MCVKEENLDPYEGGCSLASVAFPCWFHKCRYKALESPSCYEFSAALQLMRLPSFQVTVN